jgi:NDP-mannose synthase
MRAAILAGGMGTRLAPYTTVLPKPLVPVGERPILELILHQLADAGFTRVDLCVAHLGGLIRAYLGESGTVPEGLDVRYHWEDRPLGTAGAIRDLDPPDGPLLVMNGDILTTLDFADLVRQHVADEAALTVATHTQEVKIDLGVIEANGGSEVTGYIEKPTLDYEVSMGIYVYGERAVQSIPPERFDFPDLVLRLIAEGERVSRYRFDGPWFDIGTPSQHEEAAVAFRESPGLFDPAL